MRKTVNYQQGFSLVEIILASVIIGLLLGGVLKGSQVLESSKLDNAIEQFEKTSTAFYAYQDRFNRIPGDDGDLNTLQSRGERWSQITLAGNNNGRLSTNLQQTFTGYGENSSFWQHLRAAGFLNGDPSLKFDDALPRNAFGGSVGITNAVIAGGLSGLKICMSQVPGYSAIALDEQLDDGLVNTGRMRSTHGDEGYDTPPSSQAISVPYDKTLQYTLCLQI
ncbi:MAG: prepilin-type N-terminal cleavage/methylation domain-containing protein [Pseudomonadota bacterium]